MAKALSPAMTVRHFENGYTRESAIAAWLAEAHRAVVQHHDFRRTRR
jgi:hypothetical protein